MTPAQKRLAALQVEQSEKREAANALLAKDALTDDERTELDTLTKRLQAIEPELRAALTLAQGEDDAATTGADTLDAETRERLELRGRCTVTAFLDAAIKGRLPSGAEAEYAAAEGVDGIPLALFEPDPREVREQRNDASTAAPATVGVNLQPIRPAIFSESIAPRLGIEMPQVASGTYAEARIDTSLTASAKAKGGAAEATAAAFAVSTATPKRVSGRLGVRIEDVASVGQANFEAALRQNLALVLSDALDTQALTGDGQAPNLSGILQGLTDPSAPGAAAAKFDDFLASFAGGVDGLWASTMRDVAIVCGPATYQLSARSFRDVGTNNGHRGSVAFADYAREHTGGWWTNKRMPAVASNVQQAILHRKGRSGIRTAVCPHWGALSIDDVYSGSASGTRYVTVHVLVGDVLIVQPDAYAQVSYRTAA